MIFYDWFTYIYVYIYEPNIIDLDKGRNRNKKKFLTTITQTHLLDLVALVENMTFERVFEYFWNIDKHLWNEMEIKKQIDDQGFHFL